MKMLGKLLLVLVAAGLIGHSRAGDRPLDKDFLVKVASCNNAEIEISKLADSRSNSSPVKDFAAMLRKEHAHANTLVGGMLKSRKIGIAVGLEKDAREEVKRLSRLEGAEFD